MLRSRVIPCLLVHEHGLVKTVQFRNPKYVGDPINAVKIFNEKEVDELMVIDIDATRLGQEPDYRMIENLAQESRMPLCYGGGVKTPEQAQRIINLGVEKIATSSALVERSSLARELSDVIGTQSTVAVVDVKKNVFGRYTVYTRNGTKKASKEFFAYLSELQAHGVGEVVLNSIDRDGMMQGYDISLLRKVREVVDMPLTVLGGAGRAQDVIDLVKEFKVIGAAAGSLFVFKGVYKAVLINYLSPSDHRVVREMAEPDALEAGTL